MKLYISGPMSGIPRFNFPAFARAALALREQGYTVVSPHEMDSQATQEAAWASPDGDVAGLPAGETWGALLARDVKIIADEVDGIVLLPNWEKSRGARLEAVTGLLCGRTFYLFNGGNAPQVLSGAAVAVALRFV